MSPKARPEPEPDVPAVMDAFGAVLELDEVHQVAEASDRAGGLTDGQLSRAQAANATFGLAVSAELRQRRGEGANV